MGKITGKAIYENILIENQFSFIFLNILLRIPNTINELKYADRKAKIYKDKVNQLNKQIERQCSEFLDGLKSVIDPSWIQIFDCEELQLVISGKREEGFDINDLKLHLVYHGNH